MGVKSIRLAICHKRRRKPESSDEPGWYCPQEPAFPPWKKNVAACAQPKPKSMYLPSHYSIMECTHALKSLTRRRNDSCSFSSTSLVVLMVVFVVVNALDLVLVMVLVVVLLSGNEGEESREKEGDEKGGTHLGEERRGGAWAGRGGQCDWFGELGLA